MVTGDPKALIALTGAAAIAGAAANTDVVADLDDTVVTGDLGASIALELSPYPLKGLRLLGLEIQGLLVCQELIEPWHPWIG